MEVVAALAYLSSMVIDLRVAVILRWPRLWRASRSDARVGFAASGGSWDPHLTVPSEGWDPLFVDRSTEVLEQLRSNLVTGGGAQSHSTSAASASPPSCPFLAGLLGHREYAWQPGADAREGERSGLEGRLDHESLASANSSVSVAGQVDEKCPPLRQVEEIRSRICRNLSWIILSCAAIRAWSWSMRATADFAAKSVDRRSWLFAGPWSRIAAPTNSSREMPSSSSAGQCSTTIWKTSASSS
mmetsp:Transcript_71987/g.203292  ORF Transcript_71987/g.203292 Transcript_71987/m.203292 type:complete len:243 (+) Transcript_71987:762-1490(+)